MDKILICRRLQRKYTKPNFFSLEEKRLKAEEKNMTKNQCVICWSRVKQKLPVVYVSGSMTTNNRKTTNRREPRLKSNVRPFSHNGCNHVASSKIEKIERFWRGLELTAMGKNVKR